MYDISIHNQLSFFKGILYKIKCILKYKLNQNFLQGEYFTQNEIFNYSNFIIQCCGIQHNSTEPSNPNINFFGLLDPAYRCTVVIRPKPNREQTPN